jgi:chromate transporter
VTVITAALYLFFGVSCIWLVVIGIVCGLLISEYYERKGGEKS